MRSKGMMYRTAGLIDQRINATPDRKSRPSAAPMLQALEDGSRFEASIAQVLAARPWTTSSTRTCRFTAAYGFVHDYPAEKADYRDARC
jgi:hypothetical protein